MNDMLDEEPGDDSGDWAQPSKCEAIRAKWEPSEDASEEELKSNCWENRDPMREYWSLGKEAYETCRRFEGICRTCEEKEKLMEC